MEVLLYGSLTAEVIAFPLPHVFTAWNGIDTVQLLC